MESRIHSNPYPHYCQATLRRPESEMIELLHTEPDYRHLCELIFLEANWRGYRDYYYERRHCILADVQANRIRWLSMMRKLVDQMLIAQSN